jgi:hypothetical protein
MKTQHNANDEQNTKITDQRRTAAKRFGSLALILIIVCSTVASPLLVPYPSADGIETAEVSTTQSAEAQVPELNCDLNIYLSDGGICDFNLDPVDESNLDHKQAYQKGLSKIASRKTALTILNNYIKDTEDVAFLVAEREIYKAAVNNETKLQAQSAAQVAIQEYFQQKKFNYLDFWNQYLQAGINIDQTADAAMYSNDIEIEEEDTEFATIEDIRIGYVNKSVTFDKINKSITLKRGEIEAKFEKDDGSHEKAWSYFDPKNGLSSDDNAQGHVLQDINSFQTTLAPANTEDGPQKAYIFTPHWDGYSKIEQTESDVINQMSNYTDRIWPKIDSGEVDPEEVLSQVNKLNNFIAEVNPDGGGYSEVQAYLAATGMSTADLEDGNYMDIRYRQYTNDGTLASFNLTLEGTLASTSEPPTDGWQINQTYDTKQLDGSQSVAEIQGGYENLDGKFEITAVYDDSGQKTDVQNITTEDRDYTVSNTTELQNRTAVLQDIINELQDDRDENPQFGGIGGGALFGGGPLFGGNSPIPTLPGFGLIGTAVIVIIGLVAIGQLS